MVIRLPPVLEERIERAAKAKGLEPVQLVEEALKEYLTEEDTRREEVSEERRQLLKLLRNKKKTADFDAEVHAAKREAGRLYEENADWLEHTAANGTEHRSV